MNPIFGWTLALVAIVVGTALYGWQGLAVGLTIVVFWLILQFNQAIRVMRGAAGAPVGHVDSAVMLHAKLQRGMRMLDVVRLTRSMGHRESGTDETYTWSDQGGARVRVTFGSGRLSDWTLERPRDA